MTLTETLRGRADLSGSMKRRQSLIPIAAIVGTVLLALALRLPRFLTAHVVLTEGTTYASIARNLASGRGYVGILGVQDFFVPPLYPLLMAGLVRLGLDPLWAGRWLSLILGTLLPLPIYWLARELSGRRAAGLLAGLFVAGHPLLIIYAGRVWSETTYTFLIWCGLCYGWAALRRGRLVAVALAGLCFGAAYLTRHEGAMYMAVFLALLAGSGIYRLWAQKKRAAGAEGAESLGDPGFSAVRLFGQLAVALAGFAVLATPYVVWLSGQAGRLIWETKSLPNFVTAQRLGTGMSYMEAAYGLTTSGEAAGPFLFRDELLRQPPAAVGLSLVDRLRFAVTGLRDETRLFLTHWASPLAVVLALLGLLAGHWDHARLRRSGDAVLFSAALLFLLPGAVWPLALLPLVAVSWPGWDRQPLARAGFLLAFLLPAVLVISLVPRVDTRYLTPLVGYLALWCGIGLAAASRWAGEMGKDRAAWVRAARLVLVLLALAIVLHSIQGGVLGFRPPRVVLDLDQRQAGESLAVRDPSPDKRIMSVHSQLPYYAGGIHVPMPYASPELVQFYAEARAVDYVVVSSRKLTSRPLLESWLRGEDIPATWRAVYRDPDADLTIYQRSHD